MSESRQRDNGPSRKSSGRFLKALASLGGAALATAYLLNPAAGIFEALPDNLPLLGNIDEVGATVLLLFCLANLGIHIVPGKEPRTDAGGNGGGGEKSGGPTGADLKP